MKKQRYCCIGLCLVLLVCSTSCKQSVTQEEAPSERTVVTMMYPIVLEHFEELVENTYTDIDLQVEPTTSAVMNGDSERRLHNGHGTDLVITTLPTGDVKNFMLDLSATEVSTSYQATVMNAIMIDGKTRYLPLPGQYSAHIINKTFADRLMDTPPASNSQLLALLDAGRKQGVGIGQDGSMFGIDVVNSAAIGSYIIGTQVPDFLGRMDGIEWMSGLEAGTVTFKGKWNNCLDRLIDCVERGYLNTQTLSLNQTNALPVRDRMLDGSLLFCYGNVRLLSQLEEMSEQYEYDMLPFLSEQGNQPWVISSPDGYIGINITLSESGEETKLDACQRILTLLSTQEGQDAWIADTQATNSYLSNYKNTQNFVPEGLKACVAGGYIYDLRMPSNVIQYFGKNMISVLNGTAKMTDALEAVDDYCLNGSDAVDYSQSVVGSVEEDLLYENYNTRLGETAIGNLVADAVAEYTGADIAVVNGGGIRASLYQGDVLGADLAAVCPYANIIFLVETDGSVIMEMLENGISLTKRDNDVPSGRFLQVSGLCYTYRPESSESPAELLSVTLPDGLPLDAGAHYKLAITNYMAGSSGYMDNNGDGYTMLNLLSDDVPKAENVVLLEDTQATYADAMKAYFNNHRNEPVTAELEGRITMIDKDE